MIETKRLPTDVFVHLIVSLLAPMFLVVTDGDADQARIAATEALDVHTAADPIELLAAAQIIASGLAALSSISLSMAENLPIPMILRLRANATNLQRAAERAVRAMPQTPRAMPQTPEQAARSGRPVESSKAEPRNEATSPTGLVRAGQPAADAQIRGDGTATKPAAVSPTVPSSEIPFRAPMSQDAPPTMEAALAAIAADSKRRIDEADAALETAEHHEKPQSRHAVLIADQARRAAWSNAMANVAGEFTAAGAAHSSPERRTAGIRAAALTSAANQILARVAPASVLVPSRPSAPSID
jgi:hypothetical protein